MARRIGAGTAACEGRASRRKRQRSTKLLGIHLRQRSALDPSDRSQSEQHGGLKAVACPDRIHHVDGGRLDLDQTCFLVPRPSSLDPARDDDQARSRRNERLRPFPVVAPAIEILKIDIRHPHDVGGAGKRIHPIDVARLVPDQVGPAIRVDWYDGI